MAQPDTEPRRNGLNGPSSGRLREADRAIPEGLPALLHVLIHVDGAVDHYQPDYGHRNKSNNQCHPCVLPGTPFFASRNGALPYLEPSGHAAITHNWGTTAPRNIRARRRCQSQGVTGPSQPVPRSTQRAEHIRRRARTGVFWECRLGGDPIGARHNRDVLACH